MRALIIGHTGGIGAAVDANLRSFGWDVIGLSRSTHGLDFRKPDSIDVAFADITEVFDLVVIATGQLDGAGGPPEKTIKALAPDAMADQFMVNCIGPAMILRALPRLLSKNSPCKVAVLTARVGSITDNRMGGWYSYRAAKAALNQVVHTAAIELSRSHKQSCVIAYHPGTVATKFTEDYQRTNKTVSPDEAAQNMLRILENAFPENTGKFYDWRGAEVPW
ncbi:SDR family NAD(P)-dependent oxidoreductase [Pacificibacter marinus]|uniref:SDR family NAD(P)-dependent oxidoreductase n=1 Tax=Pacificibacter marinus TaxID=658057 RepID=UPI001C071C82|nr:SDR family NAD(P)-dependent oxidoreductase [Pacificibacter marinus]MBU2867094.1 SDR family NAD(P)-dependent oxidoreductase [Pacificibacter marinus]